MCTTIDKAGRLVVPKALPDGLGFERVLAGLLFVFATFSDSRHSPAA